MEISGKVAVLLLSQLNLSFLFFGVLLFLVLARAQRKMCKTKVYCIESHPETTFLFVKVFKAIDLLSVCCIKKNSALIFVM